MATGGLVPGIGNSIAQNLQAQMLQWLRCAEFSCDRAALLVSQDPKTVVSVLMKLAGGSPLLAPLLNVDAFLAQARAYEEIGSTDFGKMLTRPGLTGLDYRQANFRPLEFWEFTTFQVLKRSRRRT